MTDLLDLLADKGGSTGPASDWLLEHLVTAGHLTETGISRRARVRRCHCRARILVGLDDIVAAFEARCDPTPLTALGEALAAVTGRRTWALRREGARYVLDPRTADDIAAWPAGTRQREDVLAEHVCGAAPPAGPQVALTSFASARPPLPADAPPPF